MDVSQVCHDCNNSFYHGLLSSSPMLLPSSSSSSNTSIGIGGAKQRYDSSNVDTSTICGNKGLILSSLLSPSISNINFALLIASTAFSLVKQGFHDCTFGSHHGSRNVINRKIGSVDTIIVLISFIVRNDNNDAIIIDTYTRNIIKDCIDCNDSRIGSADTIIIQITCNETSTILPSSLSNTIAEIGGAIQRRPHRDKNKNVEFDCNDMSSPSSSSWSIVLTSLLPSLVQHVPSNVVMNRSSLVLISSSSVENTIHDVDYNNVDTTTRITLIYNDVHCDCVNNNDCKLLSMASLLMDCNNNITSSTMLRYYRTESGGEIQRQQHRFKNRNVYTLSSLSPPSLLSQLLSSSITNDSIVYIGDHRDRYKLFSRRYYNRGSSSASTSSSSSMLLSPSSLLLSNTSTGIGGVDCNNNKIGSVTYNESALSSRILPLSLNNTSINTGIAGVIQRRLHLCNNKNIEFDRSYMSSSSLSMLLLSSTSSSVSASTEISAVMQCLMSLSSSSSILLQSSSASNTSTGIDGVIQCYNNTNVELACNDDNRDYTRVKSIDNDRRCYLPPLLLSSRLMNNKDHIIVIVNNNTIDCDSELSDWTSIGVEVWCNNHKDDVISFLFLPSLFAQARIYVHVIAFVHNIVYSFLLLSVV